MDISYSFSILVVLRFNRDQNNFYRVMTGVSMSFDWSTTLLGFKYTSVLLLGYQIASSLATICFYKEKLMDQYFSAFNYVCGMGVVLAILVVGARYPCRRSGCY